jgi:GTP-binding protein HflX
VPQKEGGVLAAIDAGMIVHTKEYEGNNVHLSVTGPASLVGRFARFRLRNQP